MNDLNQSDAVRENLRFLVLEVRRQLDQTHLYIDTRSLDILEQVFSRDDYVDNLKTIIRRKCFTEAARTGDGRSLDALKSFDVVAVNLERISDFCEKITRQLAYIDNEKVLRQHDFQPLFKLIAEGLDRVGEAVLDQDASIAMEICRIEPEVDALYAKMFARILDRLKSGKDTQTLVTILFIARYLERMGDSLLNIGEAAMSAFLGEAVKLNNLDSLETLLDQAELTSRVADLNLSSMGETRSGCRIDLVTRRDDDAGASMLIFKEGRLRKLSEEKAGVDYWETLVPGIAPRVHAYRQEGENGAVLFEYLKGSTFEQLILGKSNEALRDATQRLCGSLRLIWDRTRKNAPAASKFTLQTKRRLPEIYATHENFRRPGIQIGDLGVQTLESLIEEVARIESKVKVPFQVLSHGDFNVDNVIYDESGSRIRFIDLHRTTMSDYLQDVSVFLVSNLRLGVFDGAIRRRIEFVVRAMLNFSSDHAKQVGDQTFEMRLALGLARSLTTSSRFVLDEGFATSLFGRGRYLFERIAEHGAKSPKRFALAREVLFEPF
jgi:phosphate uptake regulator